MRRLVLITAAGLLVALGGCSPTQRHTILTIFFEGVPPLEGEQKAGEPPSTAALAKPPRPATESGGSPAASAEEAGKPAPPARPAATVTTHVPFGLRLCKACHPVSRQEGGGFASLNVSATDILNKPVPKLCYGCHPDKKPTPEAQAEGWMHGPVANGVCTFCHEPHASTSPYLLKAKPSAELCGRCHQEGLMHLGEAASIEDVKECISCHFGHVGQTRYLLRPQESKGEGADAPKEGSPGEAPPGGDVPGPKPDGQQGAGPRAAAGAPRPLRG